MTEIPALLPDERSQQPVSTPPVLKPPPGAWPAVCTYSYDTLATLTTATLTTATLTFAASCPPARSLLPPPRLALTRTFALTFTTFALTHPRPHHHPPSPPPAHAPLPRLPALLGCSRRLAPPRARLLQWLRWRRMGECSPPRSVRRLAHRPPLTPARLPVPAQDSNYLENGRWYHGFRRGIYMYPCDEPEKDRMDIYHKLFAVARRDQLHQAPMPQHWEPRILDVGCGTGIWAIDMAE